MGPFHRRILRLAITGDLNYTPLGKVSEWADRSTPRSLGCGEYWLTNLFLEGRKGLGRFTLPRSTETRFMLLPVAWTK